MKFELQLFVAFLRERFDDKEEEYFKNCLEKLLIVYLVSLMGPLYSSHNSFNNSLPPNNTLCV